MNARVDVLTVMEAAMIDLMLARNTEVAVHMSEARTAIAKLLDEVDRVASFLVGHGDAAELAASRLREALLGIGAD